MLTVKIKTKGDLIVIPHTSSKVKTNTEFWTLIGKDLGDHFVHTF